MTNKEIYVKENEPIFKTRSIEVFPDGRMSIEEAAKYIGCKVPTLRKHQKEIKFVKVSKRIYFYKEDIDAWINKKNP